MDYTPRKALILSYLVSDFSCHVLPSQPCDVSVSHSDGLTDASGRHRHFRYQRNLAWEKFKLLRQTKHRQHRCCRRCAVVKADRFSFLSFFLLLLRSSIDFSLFMLLFGFPAFVSLLIPAAPTFKPNIYQAFDCITFALFQNQPAEQMNLTSLTQHKYRVFKRLLLRRSILHLQSLDTAAIKLQPEFAEEDNCVVGVRSDIPTKIYIANFSYDAADCARDS